ncbi:hypothetical protein PAEPH01_1156 [Pancytospora epiphaga]|nr:hypothetical protein PAEPH01_1156 [Pancytospora epiphaga]
MVEQARDMVDRLLGVERNAPMAKNPCYYHSLGLCPKRLLVHTKYSIGVCELDHIYVKIPENRVKQYEIELLGVLLSAYKRASHVGVSQVVLNRGDVKKIAMIKSIHSEISTLITSFPSSLGVVESSEWIEARKKRLENIHEAIESNNKGFSHNRCHVCYEPIIPGLTSLKYEKHCKSKIHKVFKTIRNKIGELARKYNITKYSGMGIFTGK